MIVKVEWCIDCNRPVTDCVCLESDPTATITESTKNRIYKTVTIAKALLDLVGMPKDDLDHEAHRLTKQAMDVLINQGFTIDGPVTRWIEDGEIDAPSVCKIMVSGWKDE